MGIYRGTFIAGKPHGGQEKKWQVEMQAVADLTADVKGRYEEFKSIIEREMGLLNARNKDLNMRYKVIDIDKRGAVIQVVENSHHSPALNLPIAIGEYGIVLSSFT